MLAVFFHNCSARVKGEDGVSSSSSSRPLPPLSSPVVVKTEAALQENGGGGSGLGAVSSLTPLPPVSAAAALDACELFGSFASALCLPLMVVHRVVELLLIAAAGSRGGAVLPVKPTQSVDEEVFDSMIKATYGHPHNTATASHAQL